MNAASRLNLASLCLLSAVLSAASSSHAQVLAPTTEDNDKVPAAFRPDNRTGPSAFAPRGTPQGYTPNPDPRDFTGSYVTGSSGPPAGGAPPGGAGGPPGGAPGAGGPPGGAPPGGPANGVTGMAAGAAQGANLAATQIACIPSFGSGAYSTHLVSSPGRLTVVGEENHRLRRIYIHGQHPKDVKPTYAADSIAHWQGNTLVIDTIAIKGQNGTHLLERWTKQADGSIDIVTDTLDADGKSKSSRGSKLVWRPDIAYVENICEDFGEAFGAGYRQKLGK
ncbi:MAG: hypothetical protein QM808_14235 [Steroidobacteraceae bacterium]